jgi:TPR repeat protein
MRFIPLLSALVLLALPAVADGKTGSPSAPPGLIPLEAWAEIPEQAAPTGHETGRYRHGATFRLLRRTDALACEAACASEAACVAWSYVDADGTSDGRCELKRGAGRQEENLLATSGVLPRRRTTVLSASPAPAADTLSELVSAARAGDAGAAFRLARIYEAGDGTARDLAIARFWVGEAARLGSRRAMHDLAVFMMDGEGGETDINGAVEWFTRAALRGEVDSQFNLAMLLLSRADQNPEALGAAYYWLLIAAGNGDAIAAEKSEEVENLLPADLAGALRAEASAFKASDN